MKRIFCMVSALTLAALMAGCANTTTGPDMAPGYDNTYGTYGTASGYGSTGSGYRGNVSTTNDGRINGANRTTTSNSTTNTNRTATNNRTTTNTTGTARTDRTGRTSTRPVNRTTTGSTSANTDAMGAGMNGGLG